MSARWFVKKASRVGVTLASGLLPKDERVVRVLTYHRFGHIPKDPFCITPEDFEAHVALLAKERRAVSLEDVKRFVRGQADLPRNACLITMDDGFVSMLDVAFPILQRHSVPSVAFVTSSMMGTPRSAELPEPFMTPTQLRALHEGGMTIGSHAYTHRSMGKLPIHEARDEVKRSKDSLEAMIGAPVTSFAYPFGTHGDFTPETDDALERAGYELSFHSQHGPLRPGMLRAGMPLISLPRVKIESGEPLWQFARISRGGMDAWRVVDRNLWRMQRVRAEITPDHVTHET